MTALQILQLVADLLSLLKQSGFLTNGTLNLDLKNLQNDVAFAGSLSQLLTKHNVAVPGEVSAVLDVVKALTQ